MYQVLRHNQGEEFSYIEEYISRAAFYNYLEEQTSTSLFPRANIVVFEITNSVELSIDGVMVQFTETPENKLIKLLTK